MIITGGDLSVFVTRPLAALLLAVGTVSLARQVIRQRRVAASTGGGDEPRRTGTSAGGQG
jgi:TctA family transporter